MKKRLYILVILALSMGFVGCHKIELNPHSCDEDRIENSEKGRNSEDDEFIRDGDDQGGITDPNHDEDEDQQRRR